MCLITVKPTREASFTDEQFKNSFNRNSDGMGMMWLVKTTENKLRVKVVRVIGDINKQKRIFDEHKNKPMWVMHQRLATHGAKDLDNCHPYKILSIDDGDAHDVYMMHNGVISNAPTSDKGMSDTWNFAQNVVVPILKKSPEILATQAFVNAMAMAIGSGSKLVFMSTIPDAHIVYVNQQAGVMSNGCWLSNSYSTVATSYIGYNYSNNNNYYENAHNKSFNFGHQPRLAHRSEYSKYLSEIRINPHGKGWIYRSEVFANYDDAREALYYDKDEEKKTEKEKEKQEIYQLFIEDAIEEKDLKDWFSEEEIKQIVEEKNSMKDVDDEEEKMIQLVKSVYDTENCNPEHLMNLIDKAAKEFTYADIECLVDAEPVAAADMLNKLLELYNNGKVSKAA